MARQTKKEITQPGAVMRRVPTFITMHKPPLQYCYYSFKDRSHKHELRMWVTDSLSLEWKLYVNDADAGRYLDDVTNILIPDQLNAALAFQNVERIYDDLLTGVGPGAAYYESQRKASKILTAEQASLTAFALFTAAMRIGPSCFTTMEIIAQRLGITDDYVRHGRDWIAYSNTVREADKQGVSLIKNNDGDTDKK